ncbi:Mss4-like protein [Hypoxylon sp. FL0543]|nr:Mss4-like protein [Hypoxylon sp. FL0543]
MATSDAKPLTVRCQCGNISFPTPAAEPFSLFHCHCTECQKQSGSAFGTSAIFPAEGLFPLAPDLAVKLKVWSRHSTEHDRSLDCYFCPECGSRLFHRIIDGDGTPRPTVSIKGGCIEGLDWSDYDTFHIFMCSAVMKIPAEWEQYDVLPEWMRMNENE